MKLAHHDIIKKLGKRESFWQHKFDILFCVKWIVFLKIQILASTFLLNVNSYVHFKQISWPRTSKDFFLFIDLTHLFIFFLFIVTYFFILLFFIIFLLLLWARTFIQQQRNPCPRMLRVEEWYKQAYISFNPQYSLVTWL